MLRKNLKLTHFLYKDVDIPCNLPAYLEKTVSDKL